MSTWLRLLFSILIAPPKKKQSTCNAESSKNIKVLLQHTSLANLATHLPLLAHKLKWVWHPWCRTKSLNLSFDTLATSKLCQVVLCLHPVGCWQQRHSKLPTCSSGMVFFEMVERVFLVSLSILPMQKKHQFEAWFSFVLFCLLFTQQLNFFPISGHQKSPKSITSFKWLTIQGNQFPPAPWTSANLLTCSPPQPSGRSPEPADLQGAQYCWTHFQVSPSSSNPSPRVSTLRSFKRAKEFGRGRRPRPGHMGNVAFVHTACGAIVRRLGLAFSHVERKKKSTADSCSTYQPVRPTQLADKTNNI